MCCNVIYGGQRVTEIMKFLWQQQQEWDGEFQGLVSSQHTYTHITWPKYKYSLFFPLRLSGVRIRFCRPPSMYLLCRINSFVYIHIVLLCQLHVCVRTSVTPSRHCSFVKCGTACLVLALRTRKCFPIVTLTAWYVISVLSLYVSRCQRPAVYTI